MMNDDAWELRKQEKFGWYVGKKRRVEALWMADVQLDESASKYSGPLASQSISALEAEINAHADKIRADDRFLKFMKNGLVKAFKISEDLGGGFMIVLPAGPSGMPAMMTLPVGVEQSGKRSSAVGAGNSSGKWWQFWKK